MELSKQECNALKGMAIIFIFIHNYCHLLTNAPTENEYSWSIERTYKFYTAFPGDFFVSLFSFFGHYGVPIFVFLSGYGLARKYSLIEMQKIFMFDYLKKHYLKLFKLMFPGLILYQAVSLILSGRFDNLSVVSFVAQILFINNLIPTCFSAIVPGPYWYFGLTMQLYVLYLLMCRFGFLKKWILLAMCLLALFLSKEHHNMTVWLKYNFIGSFLPFLLGLYFANNYKSQVFELKRMIALLIMISSLFLLFLLEFNFYTWVFACVPILCFSICFIKSFGKSVIKCLATVGKVSHLVFVIHPIFRSVLFFMQQSNILKWQSALMIYIVLTLGSSFLLFLAHKKYVSLYNISILQDVKKE